MKYDTKLTMYAKNHQLLVQERKQKKDMGVVACFCSSFCGAISFPYSNHAEERGY